MSKEKKREEENENIKKKRENEILNSPDISQDKRLKFKKIKLTLRKKCRKLILIKKKAQKSIKI